MSLQNLAGKAILTRDPLKFLSLKLGGQQHEEPNKLALHGFAWVNGSLSYSGILLGISGACPYWRQAWRPRGLLNKNEVYGSMAPDLFNFQLAKPEYRIFLYGQTHNNFQKVLDEAKSQPAMALALGFLSHNGVWGADYTAHDSGITFGQDRGYIIAKAESLLTILKENPAYQALNISDDLGMEVAHQLVENAVDILMKGLDSKIGEKIIAAALPPNPNMPHLLVKAYAGELASYAGISEREAASFIASSDRQFRNILILYGQALMLDEDAAVQALAEQLADLAQAFLAAYGISLPPGTDLVPFVQLGITQAMELCKGDFANEVEATINDIKEQLLTLEYRARFKRN